MCYVKNICNLSLKRNLKLKKMNVVHLKSKNDVLLPKKKNNCVLIHPSTMKHLQLSKGSPLLLKFLNGQILLKCWPSVKLDNSNTVLPGFNFYKHYTKSTFKMVPFKGQTFEAKKIILHSDEHKTFMKSRAFTAFLQKHLDHLYVREGMVLHLKYLGYHCCFTVKVIITNLYQNREILMEKVKHSQEDSLACDSFSNNLSLLEESFSEKCNISKLFKQDNTCFLTSTPMSSPKISAKTKPYLSIKYCPDLNIIAEPERFYWLNQKTKFVIENNSKQELCIGSATFEDIASLDKQLKDIKLLIDSILTPGVCCPIRGILIIGPSGTGKSLIAQALQNEYKYELFVQVVDKHLYTSEGNCLSQIRQIFKEAENNTPSLVFMENIDHLGMVKESAKKDKMLITEVSFLIHNLLSSNCNALVIGTAQSEVQIPTILRKQGILEKEIKLSIPTPSDRKQILKRILQKYQHTLKKIDVEQISGMAHGFTGGDLNRLILKAIYLRHWKRTNESIDESDISYSDLENSLKFIKPSSVVEFSYEKPNTKWKDIGGMETVKNAVKEMVDWPLKYPEKLKRLKIVAPRGILLYGPPGCCKTMIAKALANESQLNFINIKNSQIFNKYVGDSEKAVSELFRKARSAAPCVLFFDEIDSLVPIRGSSSGNSNVADRVVTQILIEIDGIDVLQEGICVIAATNRPDMIDHSLLRPGRIDRLIYVPLPDAYTRKKILRVILQKKPIAEDVDISYLVNKTEGYTGAEIAGICQEACMFAIKQEITSGVSIVNLKHFLLALTTVQPRTTHEMLQVFEKYKMSKMAF